MHLGRENQLLRAMVAKLELECDGIRLEKLFSHMEESDVKKEEELRRKKKQRGIGKSDV